MTVLPSDPLPGFEHLAPDPPSLEEQSDALEEWLRAALVGAGDWRAVAAGDLRTALEALERALLTPKDLTR